MKRTVKLALMLAILLPACGMLSGCNTVNGVGQDLRSAGNTLSNAAK